MNKRVATILFSAFLVAALSSMLVYRMLGKRLSVPVRHTTRVVVPNKDVPVGAVLQQADLSTTEIAGAVPKGAILRAQDAIGRGVLSNLYEGEPLVDNRLAAPGSGGGMAATIPPGMRACAIRVDDVVGVAGFVTPGMHVDVLMSGVPPGAVDPAEGPRVKTLLQNISVLSAGTDIQKDAEGKPHPVPVVNLLVSPEQAEVLSLAGSTTRIQLVLRNPLDQQTADTTGTAMGKLFTDHADAPKPAVVRTIAHHSSAPAEPRMMMVQVFNGSKRTDSKFSSEEAQQ